MKCLIDLVYIKANDFGNLQANPVDRIRVFAYKFGKLRPIPADILEFTSKNRVVLPEGSEGNPEDGDRIFSKNDMLLFMDTRWRAWYDGNVITYNRAIWKLKTMRD